MVLMICIACVHVALHVFMLKTRSLSCASFPLHKTNVFKICNMSSLLASLPFEILHGTLDTLHAALDTLHPAMETVSSALDTLHLALETLSSALDTLHSAFKTFH